MRQARIMMHAMLVSLVAVVWLTSGLSLATEPRAVTPALAPAPAPPKPRAAENESKPTRKWHPLSSAGAVLKPAAAPHPPAAILGQDGAPMVLVPAGEFTMGSEEGDDDEQPIHRVVLDSFYLDTFEVTNGRFAKFVAVGSE